MIPFSYEVIESTERGMVLRYTSPGRDPVDIGAHAPTPEESLDAIAMQYSPVAMWLDQDAQRVVVPVGTTGSYDPPPPPVDNRTPLQRAKDEKLAEIAQWRFARETGGVVLGGARIRTDRESQATINSAYTSLQAGLITSVDWKAADGQWVALTAPEMAAIAQAVAVHVQTSFSLEKQYVEQVNAATTVEDVLAVVPETVFQV